MQLKRPKKTHVNVGTSHLIQRLAGALVQHGGDLRDVVQPPGLLDLHNGLVHLVLQRGTPFCDVDKNDALPHVASLVFHPSTDSLQNSQPVSNCTPE